MREQPVGYGPPDDYLARTIGLGGSLGQFQEVCNGGRSVAPARRETDRNLDLWSLEATKDHAFDINSLHRGGNEGNTKPGGDEVHRREMMRNDVADPRSEARCLACRGDRIAL